MRVLSLVFLAFLTLSLAIPAADAETGHRSVGVIRYRDGGVLARVVTLSDGGANALLADGGSLTFRVDSHPCSADAGVLLTLLRQNSCDDDRDCAIVRPEVGASNIGCCYAVEASVARSRSLNEAFEKVADQCGWATRTCLRGCEKSECRGGVCRILEGSPSVQ